MTSTNLTFSTNISPEFHNIFKDFLGFGFLDSVNSKMSYKDVACKLNETAPTSTFRRVELLYFPENAIHVATIHGKTHIEIFVIDVNGTQYFLSLIHI